MINFPEGIKPSPCKTMTIKYFKRDRHGVTPEYVKGAPHLMALIKYLNKQ